MHNQQHSEFSGLFSGAATGVTRLLSGLVALLILGGCATNPVTGGKDFVLMSEEQEIALGQQANQQILKQYDVVENDELQNYVSALGEELASKSHRENLIFRFKLLDDSMVNAFALPGGYIYITRGILAFMQSEAQLAGVLGHEIGHVTARHGVKQQSKAQAAQIFGAIVAAKTGSRSAANGLNMGINAALSGYGRSHELEADRLGAEYLARTQFDPDDMLDVIGILKDQEQFEKQRAEAEDREPRSYHGVFASHPKNDTRLQEVIATVKQLEGRGGNRGKDNEAFLRKLDGMVFGPSEDEGVTRGNRFYHRQLDLYMQFPQGWRIENQPSSIVAVAPDNQQAIVVKLEDRSRREPPRRYLERKFNQFTDGSYIGSGIEGYAGVAPMNTPFGQRNARIAAVYKDDRVYLVQSSNKRGVPAANALMSTAGSIRGLTTAEQDLARARHIGLHRVRPGDTFASLAASSSLTNYAEAQLRLLNGMYPDGEPTPGQLIKIVK